MKMRSVKYGSITEYVLLGRSHVQWLCPRCDSMNCDSFTFNSFELSCHNTFAPLAPDSQYTSITSPSSTDPFSPKHTSSPNHPTCDNHKSYNRSIPFEHSTQRTPSISTPRSKYHVFDLPKKMNLCILNVNFQSLKNKRAEFLTALQYTKPDIVFGTETWLRGVKPGKSTTQNAIGTSELFPVDYNVFRNDRNELGGVLIMTHKSLTAEEQSDLVTDGEMNWVKIKLQNMKNLCAGVFYMPHRNKKDTQELKKSLDKLTQDGAKTVDVILGGDFNCPDINWENNSVSPSANDHEIQQAVIDITTSNLLTQIHDQPTRSPNILDIIFTSNASLEKSSSSIPGISDHNMAVADFDIKPHTTKQKPRKYDKFHKANWDKLKTDLDITAKTIQKQYNDNPGSSLRTFTPISQEELLKTIRSMSLKTCELDPLPASLYSDCLPALLPFTTDIINTSLKSGTVPDSFKSAIVRPLLKKHNLDPNELKNYRPISNLCFLSKLLEKVVLNQLNFHLSTNNLLNPFQSAYRQSHSTETALLHILNDLLLATDSGKVSLLTLLDLSAAFDTIDHTILLTRLQHTFGISDTALSWFSSYLSDRKQTVLINGIYSQSAHLTCGVPQGSVLGPVLFPLYASPLSTIIESHSLKHHFYADDTQLQDSASPENIQTLLTRTSECYSDVKNWMTNNKLKINDDKTEAILISTRQKLSQLPPLSLQLCNTTIPISGSAKNLGVHLDSTLSMQNFVSQTAKSCYYHLHRISLIRKHLNTEATVKLVLCLIMSRIDYCNSLLSGVNQSYIHTLQRIQNNAARLILKKKKTDHISPLLTQLHWLPVQKRILYKLDTICYKCLNNAAPDYLTSLLNSYKPSRTLRSASDPLTLKTPRTKLNSYGPRAFSVSGPLSWNNLPLSVRQQPTFSSFKTSLKTHLFSSP